MISILAAAVIAVEFSAVAYVLGMDKGRKDGIKIAEDTQYDSLFVCNYDKLLEMARKELKND